MMLYLQKWLKVTQHKEANVHIDYIDTMTQFKADGIGADQIYQFKTLL